MANAFDKLGELYDLMVPWETRLAKEAPFFEAQFGPSPLRVLDAACGTGRHALLFHSMGHNVVGSDISEGVLQVARAHAEKQGLALPFVREDLFSPVSGFAPARFKAVTVLGNVMALLPGPRELAIVFEKARHLLSPGGFFIFQMVNFHGLPVREEPFSPLRTAWRGSQEILFQKFFEFFPGHVVLNLLIFIKEGGTWERRVESTSLVPWRKEEFEQASRAAGFSSITFYGDYARTPYRASDSRDIIGCAVSPQEACGGQ
jgi:glycine/sarcosine N-methyltransferase